jgi:hypothetical protein
MLTKPKMKTTTPDASTSLQKGRPRDFWLVASLFMLPRMLLPSISMAKPRKLKPCAGLRTGQTRAKYSLKMEHSDTRRNTAMSAESSKTRALTARESGDDVRGSIEEEELGNGKGLDDHDYRGDYHGDEARDVHGTDDVENDEAWASQALAREGHFVGRFEVQKVDCTS